MCRQGEHSISNEAAGAEDLARPATAGREAVDSARARFSTKVFAAERTPLDDVMLGPANLRERAHGVTGVSGQ